MSNKYICKIYKGREMHRRYVQAGTLFFICLLLCKNINVLGTHYFVGSQFYFRCTVGARQDCTPSISCPDKVNYSFKTICSHTTTKNSSNLSILPIQLIKKRHFQLNLKALYSNPTYVCTNMRICILFFNKGYYILL